jgi:hypothetical protein
VFWATGYGFILTQARSSKKKKKNWVIKWADPEAQSISPSGFKKKGGGGRGETIWAFMGFELRFSKYKRGLRYSLGPLSHTSLYALMLQFNICY